MRFKGLLTIEYLIEKHNSLTMFLLNRNQPVNVKTKWVIGKKVRKNFLLIRNK